MRREDFGQRLRIGKRLGQQIEHGAQLTWQQALGGLDQVAGEGCQAEFSGIGQGFQHQAAGSLGGKGPAAALLGVSAKRHDQLAVGDAGRAGGDAAQAAEAAVNVGQGIFQLDLALENGFHQHDPAARRVHLIAQDRIRGADGQAKTAMHAGANGMRHRLAHHSQGFYGNIMLH